MATRKLTVTVPDPLLARLRDRARRANRSVEAEVLDLLAAAVPADSVPPADPAPVPAPTAEGKRPRRSHRAESNGEPGGNRPRSAKAAGPADEDALPPDIAEEVGRVEKLDTDGLLRAAKPAMSAKQSKRLADLNRKAQDEGLSAAEEKERDDLLHLYERAMVVRATALAELRKRGVDVSDLIAP
jgi:plasmid stability protein